MAKQLFKQQLGSNASVEADILDDGRASVQVSGQYLDAKSGIEFDGDFKIVASPKLALEQLKVMIPGNVDDMIIDGLEAYLGIK